MPFKAYESISKSIWILEYGHMLFDAIYTKPGPGKIGGNTVLSFRKSKAVSQSLLTSYPAS